MALLYYHYLDYLDYLDYHDYLDYLDYFLFKNSLKSSYLCGKYVLSLTSI